MIDSNEVTTKKPVFYSCVFLGFGPHLQTPHCVLVAFTETQWVWLQKEESGKQTYVWLALLKTLPLSKLRVLCSLLLKLKPWLLRSDATHHVWAVIQLTITLNKGGDECVHEDRAQVKYDGKPYISGSACTFLLSAGEQEKLHWAASGVGHVLTLGETFVKTSQGWARDQPGCFLQLHFEIRRYEVKLTLKIYMRVRACGGKSERGPHTHTIELLDRAY